MPGDLLQWNYHLNCLLFAHFSNLLVAFEEHRCLNDVSVCILLDNISVLYVCMIIIQPDGVEIAAANW